MKKAVLPALISLLSTVVVAHSGEDTPGIALHHVPVWTWAGIGIIIITLIYIIYVQTHDKSFNPLNW